METAEQTTDKKTHSFVDMNSNDEHLPSLHVLEQDTESTPAEEFSSVAESDP